MENTERTGRFKTASALDKSALKVSLEEAVQLAGKTEVYTTADERRKGDKTYKRSGSV